MQKFTFKLAIRLFWPFVSPDRFSAHRAITVKKLPKVINFYMMIGNASRTPYFSLPDVIKRINAAGYRENFYKDSSTIQRICKSFRETQRNSINRQKEFIGKF